MSLDQPLGRIVVLNGVPRSGKSSIVAAIQARFDGAWMNIGLDRFKAMTPDRFQPGIGLRPGGERPDLEPLVATLIEVSTRVSPRTAGWASTSPPMWASLRLFEEPWDPTSLRGHVGGPSSLADWRPVPD